MLVPAYERLKQYLGIESETQLFSRAFQYARIEEEVMARFEADIRPLVGPLAPGVGSIQEAGDSFTDYWGITWERPPGALYYHMCRPPLQQARTPADIEDYAWPDIASLLDVTGLSHVAKGLRRDTEYAILGIHEGPGSIFEMAWHLRGMSEFMIDLASDADMAHALLRRLTDLAKEAMVVFLSEVGDWIDIIQVGDDLGTQNGALISPRMFRTMVKPYLAEFYALIHDLTPAKLMLHSCGSVHAVLGDLIEIGVDVLNPVQVSARDMDTQRLKTEFGDRISFCGGIDTHRVLPYGTPADVREEVQRRIRDLAPGGGYLLAAVHAIQPDVPPENVIAMFDAALTYGHYR
jgi:uroporphyrinogen decarboxylase